MNLAWRYTVTAALLALVGLGCRGREDRAVGLQTRAVPPALPSMAVHAGPQAHTAGRTTAVPDRDQPATSRTPDPLAFESAAIAPADTPLEHAPANPTYSMRRVSLRQLIQTAYGITNARMSGGPSWMDDDWQVAAKAADPSAPYTDVRQMLRRLLTDRFGLKAAFVTEPTSTVVLSFATGAHGVRPARTAVDCAPFLGGLRPLWSAPRNEEGYPLCGPADEEHSFTHPLLHFRSAPLRSLARNLEIMLRRVVIISPAREGLFDFDFQCPTGYVVNDPTPDVNAFLTAVEDQLGARAVVRTTRVRILAIQHATRPD
jgi:uncharacterized protein (TIGR03435 family)